MATAIQTDDTFETVGELIMHLGGIDPQRIIWKPIPGTATEKELLCLAEGGNKRLCELVDGVLVEKSMGNKQSFLAATLIGFLLPFVRKNRLGKVGAPDSLTRMPDGNVRMPDVMFISRDRWKTLADPNAAIADLCPDLAVEVLSPSNTRAEMARKRRENFAGGTRLIWEIDEQQRIVNVYTSPTDFRTLSESDSLDGADIVPGFRLDLVELFNDPSDYHD